ncbi:MAG TPA: hypothetical protein VGB02_13330 [Pyrinomonadaceae bacterium]|jgi:hypothetical protein
MSVEGAVSFEAIIEELVDAGQFAASAGVKLEISQITEQNLRFFATFRNRAGTEFFAEFDCHDYPLYPPTIEFTDEKRTVKGNHSLYPNVFHPTPCVCMRYNRKAYTERGGPHGDWRLIDWHLATPGGGPINTLAMIISDMHTKILDSTGRMNG